MALNKDALAAAINEALRKADQATAPAIVHDVKGEQTTQRVAFAQALAEQIIKHIVENAEVIIPPHDPFRTDLGGTPPHPHTVTVPVRHAIGKIR